MRIAVTRDLRRPRARRRSCWWCRRRRCARSRRAGDGGCAADADHHLRQGHRARHPQIHDRDDRRMRAGGDARDPVGAELCVRRGARTADRGDACGAGRGAGGARWRRRLASRTFRPYQSSDVRGVEIGGAAKNVLAIASGIVTGRGLGASASAALTTRGFAELVRFGRAYGARTETMMGLSGLGDLILTCSSPQSRNFSFGDQSRQGHRREGHSRQDRTGRRRVHRAGAAGDGAGEAGRHADRRRRSRRCWPEG